MKNNKMLFIVVIVIMNLLAGYTLWNNMSEGSQKTNETEEKLELARQYAERNLCKRAILCYKELLSQTDTVELRKEIVATYKKGLETLEFQDEYELEGFIEETLGAHIKEPEAYEMVMEYYLEKEDEEKFYNVLKQAKNREFLTEKASKWLEERKYSFYLGESLYSNCPQYSQNYYLRRSEENYNYMDTKGEKAITGSYSYASIYSDGYMLVRYMDYLYLMDVDGTRLSYFDDGITDSTGCGDGLIACLKGDKYSYYHLNGELAFGEYDFAGKFSKGIAAVKEGEIWRLIHIEGDYLVEQSYLDVKRNQAYECINNNRIFVKESGTYRMLDGELQPVNGFECDDVDSNVCESYLAFARGGKWGYVDIEGNVVIEPQYEEARSFSQGLGAIREGNEWKFIDGEGKVVIAGGFQDVNYFFDPSFCFVKKDGYWMDLHLWLE